jgi:transcriptional regulator with XRE-family HTH domain
MVPTPSNYTPVSENMPDRAILSRDERRKDDKWKRRVGAGIKRCRTGHGLTQAELGRRTGLDWTTISNIERGETAPDFATIDAIADVLEVSVDWLTGRLLVEHLGEIDAARVLEANATLMAIPGVVEKDALNELGLERRFKQQAGHLEELEDRVSALADLPGEIARLSMALADALREIESLRKKPRRSRKSPPAS